MLIYLVVGFAIVLGAMGDEKAAMETRIADLEIQLAAVTEEAE